MTDPSFPAPDMSADQPGGRTPPRLSFVGGQLRLRTLLFLRWLAIAGQTLSVVIVQAGLGFELPVLPCLSAIALSVVLNVALTVRYEPQHRLNGFDAGLMLAYDIFQLGLLLYLTGGISNPFAFLVVVPATVSASALPLRSTMILSTMVLAIVTLLMFFHLPLPWYPGQEMVLDTTYRIAIWAAIVISLLFITLYAWRIASEARRMSDALVATELVLAREQRFSALDGLATAAAHELGTPLGTIAITVNEMRRELGEDSELAEDLELLRSQVSRCRTILGTLAEQGGAPDEMLNRVLLSELLTEVARPFQGDDDPVLRITCRPSGDGCGREPQHWRSPGTLYAIGNMLGNALDFAEAEVQLRAVWTAYDVTITVSDDGPGFSETVMHRLGEPFVSSRLTDEPAGAGGNSSGMGLGFFIAKTLLERAGARVEIRNQPEPEHGAVIDIIWPREIFEAAKPISGD